MLPRVLITAPVLAAALAAPAAAAPVDGPGDAPRPRKAGLGQLVVSGGGFGHGVGLSQYGAYGMARQGANAATILRHYYTGTRVSRLTGTPRIRVILQANDPFVRFRGGARAGARPLSPRVTYRVERAGDSRLRLETSSGARLAVFTAPLRITGPGPLRLLGGAMNGVTDGRYRGALELRPGRNGGVNAVNHLDLDDYVRGVISAEMPASWHLTALRVQAVAARTYAITTDAGGVGFDQWPDTRSQVYRGIAAETARTDRAVRTTARQVVTYDGRPVTTFFMSTSGGRTESVENVFGGSARPWLRSVADPADRISPLHRWTRTFSATRAAFALGARGTLREIRVVGRGDSPRVLQAEVIGSRGRTRITGGQIQARLGLPDRPWSFRVR